MRSTKLSNAFRETRRKLGYATAEAGYRAQQSLTYTQFTNREQGRTEMAVSDLITLAKEWGVSPAELFCLWIEEYDSSTFAPIAEKSGLTINEARKRFEAKRRGTGLSFEHLYLLLSQGQITL